MSEHLTDPPEPRGRRATPSRTVEAFLSRGFDAETALRLEGAGFNLGKLKQATEAELAELGLNEGQIRSIRQGGRAVIPGEVLTALLWANRWACCVCRMPGRAIVVHHIRPWAESHDHSPENLAVLCTEHHAHAHRRGDLEQNLSQERLLYAKARWESAVRELDSQAVLEAARVQGHHWLWFNHRRLLETADELAVDRTGIAAFPLALSRGFIDAAGTPRANERDQPHIASGGEGIYLLNYLRDLFHEVLERTALFNISDHLDRGVLGRVISPGDLILVQGRHVFKERTKRNHGPGQAMEVRRQANGVRVTFTIDRWEAVATSAWGYWLRGVQRVASVVRVNEVMPGDRVLELRCSGLAIGLALQGLSNRSYINGHWPQVGDECDDDDWLAEELMFLDGEP